MPIWHWVAETYHLGDTARTRTCSCSLCAMVALPDADERPRWQASRSAHRPCVCHHRRQDVVVWVRCNARRVLVLVVDWLRVPRIVLTFLSLAVARQKTTNA